jgi:hypothetical protein
MRLQPRSLKLQPKCLKVERPNFKAMVEGLVLKDGRLQLQSIWLTVRPGDFPALLTYQRGLRPPRRFPLSPIGQEFFDAEKFKKIPPKYVYAADLESTYFVKNEKRLWQDVCSNELFDIWDPSAPYSRFADCEADPGEYRIQLLRVYKIDREFSYTDDIDRTSDTIDRLKPAPCEVGIESAVISDQEFANLKNRLESSVAPHLTPRP